MKTRSGEAVESTSEDVQNHVSVSRQTETPSPEARLRSVAGWHLRRGNRGTRRDFDHLSDEALIALVGRGDDEAFGALYDRFSRIAYGLALRILRDRALAEDAVQDGFLAIWRSAPSFSAERSKPSTWVLTLVHRRAVDLVRREERRRTEPIDEVEHPAGGATDAEAALRSQRRLVQEALRRLPDEQREALELAYYGGFSQSELAERLGQPLGTIKSRMFTGLARLRDLLAEAGLEAELGR
jgi:RNA polymerase sigma-70 factor, ECF subfamily